MALSRLGDYIELVDERNTDNIFDYTKLRGISINKILIPTKATGTENLNLKNYKIVRKGQFAYCTVTSRNGNKMSIAYNDDCDCIVSSINPVFKIKDEQALLPRYLMMFFNRGEFDRYARFNSWGSARETFMWEDMCDIELEIPPINIQQKYVDIYEGLLSNLRAYEKGIEDLRIVYTGYIERLRKEIEPEAIIPYLKERTESNKNNEDLLLRGVGLKGFIKPNQIRTKESLKKCNIFYKGDFVYAPSSFKNGVISYNDLFDKALCTEEYIVFYIKDLEKLNPYYLLMWLKREELGRSIDFYVMDSVRNRFYFDSMEMINIPIPNISVQNNIANVYVEYLKRIEYAESIREKIKNICPILIRGAVKEAKGGN